MNINQIAAQLYTVREFTKTPEDIERTLKKVKAIGYRAVQVSAFGPVDPARLKEMADSNGLRICVTHTPIERLRGDLDNVIKEHKLWNCRYVGLGSMPKENRGGRDGFMAFVREFSEIARKISAGGLKFVYHNHKFEFEKFDGVRGMDILFEETEPSDFGFELDTYWVQAGGADPVEWIRKAEGRMDVVHLKDMAIRSDQQVFAEIGQGNLNWPKILKACEETGVSWYAVEQDTCPGDPFESLSASFRYLEGIIK